MKSKDEWINWSGAVRFDDAPVPDDTTVEYIRRSGGMSEALAGDLSWSHRGYNSDIMFYRVLQLGSCVWSQAYDESDAYESTCGESMWFMGDGPKENNFKYCPFCGAEIKEN